MPRSRMAAFPGRSGGSYAPSDESLFRPRLRLLEAGTARNSKLSISRRNSSNYPCSPPATCGSMERSLPALFGQCGPAPGAPRLFRTSRRAPGAATRQNDRPNGEDARRDKSLVWDLPLLRGEPPLLDAAPVAAPARVGYQGGGQDVVVTYDPLVTGHPELGDNGVPLPRVRRSTVAEAHRRALERREAERRALVQRRAGVDEA